MTDPDAPDLAQAQICALPTDDRASQGANLPLATEDAARDRVLGIIRARCGDVLTDNDLALLSVGKFADRDPDTLPASIGEDILDVLAHMMDRMDKIERSR